jgi:hypothetical protein
MELAFGLTRNNYIAIVDTESGSASLYSHLGEYYVVDLSAPFTPERYVEAMELCVHAGADVVILDSLSHEWDGSGGILETHGSMPGNSFANWAKITPRHNALTQHILNARAHFIVTLRSKQEYALKKDDRGRTTP